MFIGIWKVAFPRKYDAAASTRQIPSALSEPININAPSDLDSCH